MDNIELSKGKSLLVFNMEDIKMGDVMWKLVVADDEPKIRRGIKNILNWNEFNIEIVGEAEDGEIALKVIRIKNQT